MKLTNVELHKKEILCKGEIAINRILICQMNGNYCAVSKDIEIPADQNEKVQKMIRKRFIAKSITRNI